jgi:hypothetical protein
VRLRHPDVAALPFFWSFQGHFLRFRSFQPQIPCPFDHFGRRFPALSIISAADFLRFRSFQPRISCAFDHFGASLTDRAFWQLT